MSTSPIHSADIQARLKKMGLKQCDLAREFQVSEAAISACIRYGQGALLRTRISQVIGIDVDVLWPHLAEPDPDEIRKLFRQKESNMPLVKDKKGGRSS